MMETANFPKALTNRNWVYKGASDYLYNTLHYITTLTTLIEQ